MPKVVIWGASGHALVVADTIRLEGVYEIIGMLDDRNPERGGSEYHGFRVLGGREQLEGLRREGVEHAIVGVGDCAARLALADLLVESGFRLATAIHPRAILAADVKVGAGTLVVAGSVINPAAILGDNVIVNTGASVDHECILEDGVHIAPGVHMAAGVEIGRGAWVGIGSIVKERVRIGRGSLIGAGSLVLNDIPDGVIAYGRPAKVVRPVAGNASQIIGRG
jgi:acetyltransferase EpsM